MPSGINSMTYYYQNSRCCFNKPIFLVGTGRSKKRDKCQNTDVHPQVETEPCPCAVFTSRSHGNWSECIISVEQTELQLGLRFHRHPKECGEGVRFQALACYDKIGRLVEPSHCNHSGKICAVYTNSWALESPIVLMLFSILYYHRKEDRKILLWFY